METNSIILVAAICIVIGFLIGRLVSSFSEKPGSSPAGDQDDAVLKVWHQPGQGDITIEMEAKEYRGSYRLNDRQRDLLNRIILELNSWLDAGMTQRHRDDRSTLRVVTPPDGGVAETPKPRFNINPVNVLADALRADIPKSQLPVESIVTQIDDILQEKLKQSPFISDPIRLMERPDKGIVVMVGLEQYDSVEEVPDESIKSLIRSAVKEWEQRGSDIE